MGDLVASLEDVEAQNEKCKTRMAKLVGFVRSRDFIRDLLVCCFSSIHRWGFPRGIQSAKCEEKKDACGAADAMTRMIAEADKTLQVEMLRRNIFWIERRTTHSLDFAQNRR